MELLTLEMGAGRRKVIERRMTRNCLACNDRIECPDGGDFWAWHKSDAVNAFNEKHANCPPRCVGSTIVETEKE